MTFARRVAYWIGYRLPPFLQRPFHHLLYDDPLPDSDRLAIVPPPDDGGFPVRFEFVRGSRDGEVHEGITANPYYWKAEYGRVGARFLVPTPAAVDEMMRGRGRGPILDQEYEVVRNVVEDGVRIVRAEARRPG